MVKIDVKDLSDNVHGGERDMTCFRPWTWGRPLLVQLVWWWAWYLSLSREVFWKVEIWDSFFLKISGRWKFRILVLICRDHKDRKTDYSEFRDNKQGTLTEDWQPNIKKPCFYLRSGSSYYRKCFI